MHYSNSFFVLWEITYHLILPAPSSDSIIIWFIYYKLKFISANGIYCTQSKETILKSKELQYIDTPFNLLVAFMRCFTHGKGLLLR